MIFTILKSTSAVVHDNLLAIQIIIIRNTCYVFNSNKK